MHTLKAHFKALFGGGFLWVEFAGGASAEVSDELHLEMQLIHAHDISLYENINRGICQTSIQMETGVGPQATGRRRRYNECL